MLAYVRSTLALAPVRQQFWPCCATLARLYCSARLLTTAATGSGSRRAFFATVQRSPMQEYSFCAAAGRGRSPAPSISLRSPPFLVQQRPYGSSFINQVMEQVKREMETNEALKQSMKEFRESGIATTSTTMRQRLENHVLRLRKSLEHATARVTDATEALRDLSHKTQESLSELQASNPAVRTAIAGIGRVLGLGKAATIMGVDAVTSLVDGLKDEKAEAAKKRAVAWKEDMERRRAATGSSSSPDSTKTDEVNANAPEGGIPSEDAYALVLAEESAWDRFGTKLRDMPFLQNFFENSVLGKLFGETAQAAAIREMKSLDPAFR